MKLKAYFHITGKRKSRLWRGGLTKEQVELISDKIPELMNEKGKVDYTSAYDSEYFRSLVTSLNLLGIKVPRTIAENTNSDLRIEMWVDLSDKEKQNAPLYQLTHRLQLATASTCHEGEPVLDGKIYNRSLKKRNIGLLDTANGIIAFKKSLLERFKSIDGFGYKILESNVKLSENTEALFYFSPETILPKMNSCFHDSKGAILPESDITCHNDSECYPFLGFFFNHYYYEDSILDSLENWHIAKTFEFIGSRGIQTQTTIVSRAGKALFEKLDLGFDFLPIGYNIKNII